LPPTAGIEPATVAARPRSGFLLASGLTALLLVAGAIVFTLARLSMSGGDVVVTPTAPGLVARATPPGDAKPTPTARPDGGEKLTEVDLAPVADARLDKVAFQGPESFSVGNLSVGMVGQSLWIFGEVRNDGPESREAVQVRVNLLDSAGKELASQEGFAHLSYLKPGEISSFSVLFSGENPPPPAYASYTIEVRSRKADFQPGYTIRDLRIGDQTRVGKDSLGFLILRGSVRNSGATPARYVHIFVVFYDAAGAVVGVADSFAETADDKIVAAGAEVPFEVQGLIFTSKPASYRTFAQGSSAD
jgi:hypothetical protein